MKVCAAPGCPNLTTTSRCASHTRAARRLHDRQRGNSTQRGYGRKWKKIRAEFLEAHRFCMAAGCPELATEVDHVVPRARGGSDEWHNLQALCKSHHSRKTATSDGGFGFFRERTP